MGHLGKLDREFQGIASKNGKHRAFEMHATFSAIFIFWHVNFEGKENHVQIKVARDRADGLRTYLGTLWRPGFEILHVVVYLWVSRLCRM